MQRQIRPHGPDHGQVVGTSRDAREQFADRQARLSVPAELPGRFEPLPAALRRRIVDFANRLAVEFLQFRFRIERVDVRHTAVHEQEDCVLGSSGEVRAAVRLIAWSCNGICGVVQRAASATEPNPFAATCRYSRRDNSRGVRPKQPQATFGELSSSMAVQITVERTAGQLVCYSRSGAPRRSGRSAAWLSWRHSIESSNAPRHHDAALRLGVSTRRGETPANRAAMSGRFAPNPV